MKAMHMYLFLERIRIRNRGATIIQHPSIHQKPNHAFISATGSDENSLDVGWRDCVADCPFEATYRYPSVIAALRDGEPSQSEEEQGKEDGDFHFEDVLPISQGPSLVIGSPSYQWTYRQIMPGRLPFTAKNLQTPCHDREGIEMLLAHRHVSVLDAGRPARTTCATRMYCKPGGKGAICSAHESWSDSDDTELPISDSMAIKFVLVGCGLLLRMVVEEERHCGSSYRVIGQSATNKNGGGKPLPLPVNASMVIDAIKNAPTSELQPYWCKGNISRFGSLSWSQVHNSVYESAPTAAVAANLHTIRTSHTAAAPMRPDASAEEEAAKSDVRTGRRAGGLSLENGLNGGKRKKNTQTDGLNGFATTWLIFLSQPAMGRGKKREKKAGHVSNSLTCVRATLRRRKDDEG
ncbi:hypothetical protein L249_5149 [Ophiocordyceps polyrhachis-furcata BCC 54312]|uniref:Uncharacterized protein n=1 Tax=Ophiocordyceps polyrhachis-furcata BCC 54312 TaxID=1330021 RepID=A0A367L3N5_9HYPO|nr:hypothetical protein L249_5149 [Ophiocordyceps polyrhachis-furcata BCC 54312]